MEDVNRKAAPIHFVINNRIMGVVPLVDESRIKELGPLPFLGAGVDCSKCFQVQFVGDGCLTYSLRFLAESLLGIPCLRANDIAD